MNALLCAVEGNKFGAPIGAFIATICKFCNGYYRGSTPASVDTILSGINY